MAGVRHTNRPARLSPATIARVAALLREPHDLHAGPVEPVAAPPDRRVNHDPVDEGAGQAVPPHVPTRRPRLPDRLPRPQETHDVTARHAGEVQLEAGEEAA